jgi:hypothetical protein
MACVISGTSVRNSTYEASAQSSDSCPTTHVCNNRRWLLNFRPAEEGEHLITGNSIGDTGLQNVAFVPTYLPYKSHVLYVTE